MELLYTDLYNAIFDYVPQYDLVMLKLTCKALQKAVETYDNTVYFYAILNDKDLIEATENNDYISIIRTPTELDWNSCMFDAVACKYQHIIDYARKKGARFNKLSMIYAYCQGGDYDTVSKILEHEDRIDFSIDMALHHACAGGNMNLIKLFISKGAKDWDMALDGAVRGGNADIVKFILSKKPSDIDYAFSISCSNGDPKITEMLCNYANKSSKKKKMDRLNFGFDMACNSGNVELCKMFINKYHVDAKQKITLFYACKCGKKDMIDFAISLGIDDWNVGLAGACASGNKSIIKMMIDKGADDWDQALPEACFSGDLDLIKFLIDKGAKALESAIVNAAGKGHLDIVKYIEDIIMKNHMQYDVECFNRAMLFACESEQIDIVDHLMHNDFVEEYDDCMLKICENGNCEIFEKLFDYWNNDLLKEDSVDINQLLKPYYDIAFEYQSNNIIWFLDEISCKYSNDTDDE